MSAVSDRRARGLEPVYRAFGEAADWEPADGSPSRRVTVRRVSDEPIGEFNAPVETNMLRVRVAELGFAPARGDRVRIDPEGSAPELLEIVADPIRARLGLEWVCEAGDPL